MGILSFGLGLCAGYYLKYRGLTKELERRVLVMTKLLVDKHIPDHKLVLIVRDDLNMSRGKIASQCSHASVLAYKDAENSQPEIAKDWYIFGQTKIVLRTTSELKLLELSKEAKKLGLVTNIVCDAGKTEINPGTKTVLAIGPGPRSKIDKVTASLKLLG